LRFDIVFSAVIHVKTPFGDLYGLPFGVFLQSHLNVRDDSC
jgi:hypothetical protein